MAQVLSRLIKSLNSNKEPGLDKIPVAKKIYPELSSVPAIFFLTTGEMITKSRKSAKYIPVFKDAGGRSYPLQNRLISLLSVISKPLESIINKKFVERLNRNTLNILSSYEVSEGLYIRPVIESSMSEFLPSFCSISMICLRMYCDRQ